MTNQKNIYTIAPEADYLKLLATYIYSLKGGDMLALSRVKVILPNRRSMLKLKEYFVEISPNKAVILPEIFSLGDLEEDELEISQSVKGQAFESILPVMSSEKRLLMLAKMIREKGGQGFDLQDISFDAALKLALSLASLLDEVEKHGLHIDNLENILPEELSKHRQVGLEFIRFIFAEYPNMLKDAGMTDNAHQTNQIIDLYAAHLCSGKQDAEIFIAGSTGSIPATRRLIKTILNLEKGYVILPYIDLQLNSFDWDEIGSANNPISHQKHVRNLLKFLEVRREDVRYLQSEPTEKESIVSELMKPATNIESWKNLKKYAAELGWLKLIEARNAMHEAKLIGTIIRHKLDGGRSVALVTNNKELAERTCIYLKKFGVNIDDSSGSTLDETSEGKFLVSVASLISKKFNVTSLLSVLKNEHFDFLDRTELSRFEARFIRKHNIRYLSEIFEKFSYPEETELKKILEKIYRLSSGLSSGIAGIPQLIERTYDIMNLTKLDREDNEKWQKIEESLNNFSQGTAQDIEVSLFADCTQLILSGKKIWPKYNPSKTVTILSAQEARLQYFDVVVLGGLTLGSWPAGKFSPWFSRKMYKEMELPFEEESISLSAHDFAALLHRAEVFLTYPRYESGEPVIESPFITRMKAFHKAVTGRKIDGDNIYSSHLEAENDVVKKENILPRPVPPLEARPKKLSVTKIETILKNPYAIYASEVLNLRKLDDMERELEAKDYGTFVHKILEDFTNAHALDDGKITEAAFNNIVDNTYAEFEKLNKADIAWLAQVKQLGPWFVDVEKASLLNLKQIFSEKKGELKVGDFTITGKADRIEITQNNKLNIIDYKTGSFPEVIDVKRLIAPQIPLEALMLKHNAIEGIQNSASYKMGDMIYCNFSFSYEGPEKSIYNAVDLNELVPAVEVELNNLIADINNPKTPFLVRPNPEPKMQPKFDEYEHLERLERSKKGW